MRPCEIDDLAVSSCELANGKRKEASDFRWNIRANSSERGRGFRPGVRKGM